VSANPLSVRLYRIQAADVASLLSESDVLTLIASDGAELLAAQDYPTTGGADLCSATWRFNASCAAFTAAQGDQLVVVVTSDPGICTSTQSTWAVARVEASLSSLSSTEPVPP